MAWIEDAEQRVLLVRQALGLRLWTLPGQKTPQSIQQSALLSPGPERSSFFLSFPSEP